MRFIALLSTYTPCDVFSEYPEESSSKRCRSNHLRCSVRKGVLRNFAKFTGNPLRRNLFFVPKLLAQVFSCEFCEISKDTFFTEHL